MSVSTDDLTVYYADAVCEYVSIRSGIPIWDISPMARLWIDRLSSEAGNVLHDRTEWQPVFHKVSGKDLSGGTSKMVVKERELVFDIDMNDYDDIRTCCKDKKVCSKCCSFPDDFCSLENFGFENILWVFSGRRGIHCWVCDEAARRLPPSGRAALVGYMNVITGSAAQMRKVRLPGRDFLHPFLRQCYEIALPYFQRLLTEQDFFRRGSPLQMAIDSYMQDNKRIAKKYNRLKEQWNGSSVDLWSRITESLTEGREQGQAIAMEIVFHCCFPRLDIQVTKDTGHLLKAPFCVHPSTGFICVPIRYADRHSFDPTSPPTLNNVLQQLRDGTSMMRCFNSYRSISSAEADVAPRSLASFVSTFEDFARACCKKSEEDENQRFFAGFKAYLYRSDAQLGSVALLPDFTTTIKKQIHNFDSEDIEECII